MSHFKRSERKELRQIIMSLRGVLRSKLSSQYWHRCVRTRLEQNCGGIFIPWQSSSFLITCDRKSIVSGVYAPRMFHTTSNVYIFPKLSSHWHIIAGVKQYPHGSEEKNHKAPHQDKDTDYSTKYVQKKLEDKSASYPVHFTLAQKDEEYNDSFTFVEDIKMRKRYEKIHKELIDANAMTVKQYDPNTNSVLHKLSPPEKKALPIKQGSHKLSAGISDAMDVKKQQKHPGRKKTKVQVVKYPFMNMSKATPRKTLRFQSTKAFLESLNIPCDELMNYPDIQTMTKDEILDSLILLKENGIHNIFSLFLIQRIFLEKTLPVVDSSSSAKYLRHRVTKLLHLRDMQVYLDLCKDLECPDLDIRHLLDRLAKLGQFFTIKTVSLKIKQLKSLGARSEDVLDNLEELFSFPVTLDKKIKLYASTQRNTQAAFPMKLFLIRNINDFMEQLGIGPEVKEVAKLLGVSVATFQQCWGFKDLDTKKLKYKIHKCLSAGIPQKEIFNNIPTLNMIPLEKCHAVTSSFRSSGLPVSLLVLNHMGDTVGVNRNNNSKDRANGNNNKKVTDCESSAESSNIPTDRSCPSLQHQDWTGEAMEPPSEDAAEEQQTNLALERETRTTQAHNKIRSSKKQRREVFCLIKYLLQLERSLLHSMFACQIKLDYTNVLDVRKNFDLLLSLNFTKENIASCPLVLVHPHKELAVAVRKVDQMVTDQFKSLSSSSSSPSLLSSTGSPVELTSDNVSTALVSQREKDKKIKETLFACPTKHLNTIQYYLERENSFNLSAIGHQRLGGFLNLR